MQVSADRTRKGELKMYGLMLEIRQVWQACGEVHGGPIPGGQLDLAHVDDVVVALDHALVGIRTLDLEVFQRSDEKAYLAIRDDPTSRLGLTVRALTAPRNSAVHHADVVDPNIASASGPMPGTTDRYLINPRWKTRSEIPSRMFEDDDGKLRATLAMAYDTACAGLPVLDTLLDAFSFFDGTDSRLARREPDGTLTGFPLTPYPVANRYRRLAPDWPTEAEWGVNHRRQAQSRIPAGRREILGAIKTPQGTVLCGNTMRQGRTTAFTEEAEQVARDVANGASYSFEPNSGFTGDARLIADALAVAKGPVDLAGLSELAGHTRPWDGWWELCIDDAEYYAQQRR